VNVLLAGVGGQGILFVTGLMAHLAVEKGWPVAACETHGMAQRGGSVVSHLRMGKREAGPLIRRGKADLLLGLNEDEGLRHLAYLRRGGSLLLEQGRYIAHMNIQAASVPAMSLAREAGFPLGANLIILGAACALGWLPFSAKELERGLRDLSREAVLDQNLESLRLGLQNKPHVGKSAAHTSESGTRIPARRGLPGDMGLTSR
jgi:indolepyruvate ferredoxin oxidoreductase beta subunit